MIYIHYYKYLTFHKEYPKDQELFLSKKVKKYLLPKKDEIFKKLDSYKYNNKYISFFLLKK